MRKLIEALNDLGSLVLGGSHQDFVETLTLSLKGSKDKPHIIFINLDTRARRVHLGINEIDEKTSPQYLWIGNESGNNPQWYVTTDKVEYLLSQTIHNLITKLPEESPLAQALRNCLDVFFVDLGNQEGSDERYRRIFEAALFDGSTNTLEIFERLKKAKKVAQEVGKIFYDYLKQQTGLTKKEAALFTLLIDGKPVAFEPEYRALVAYEKVDVLFSDVKLGICGACGLDKMVTTNTTKFKFKYYITDKISFAHGFDKKFSTNLSLCSECYKQILAAENLVMKYLSVRIGTGSSGLNIYIVPQFLLGSKLGFDELTEWLEKIKFAFETMRSFQDKLTEFEDKLEIFKERKARYDNYYLNLLFYQRAQQELKVLNLIQDVPPSRMTLITETISEVSDLGDRLLGESHPWNWALDFNKIFYLFPPKIDKKERKVIEYRQLLHIFDCIFSGKPLDFNLLMEEFVELIQIYRYERFERYGMSKPQNVEGQFVRAVLLANLFLIFATELKILQRKGGKLVDISRWQLDEEIKAYINEVGFGECETGLFLLGYLLGEAANAQYNDGKTSKPILDKLNYQGMDIMRVQRLSLEVFEKLKQYKKLRSPMVEIINSCAMQIISKYSTKWPLSHLENVFYIVSGYAYCTNRILRKAAEKKEK